MTTDSVLAADISQTSCKYSSGSRGKQCVTNSFIFLCHICVKDPFRLSKKDLQIILDLGDILYCSVHQKIEKDFLLISDLPESLYLETSGVKGYFTFAVCQSYSGCLNEGFASNIGLSLEDSFLTAHARNIYVPDRKFILVFHSSAVGIAAVSNIFYIFDPHNRGKDGLCSGHGTCVLSTCNSLHKLCAFLRNLACSISGCDLCDTQFDLHLLTVTKVKRISLPVQVKIKHPECQNTFGNKVHSPPEHVTCPAEEWRGYCSENLHAIDQSTKSRASLSNEERTRENGGYNIRDFIKCLEVNLLVPHCYIFLCISCLKCPDLMSEVEVNDILCVSKIFYNMFKDEFNKDNILIEELPPVLKLEIRDMKSFFSFKVVKTVKGCMAERLSSQQRISLESSFLISNGSRLPRKRFAIVFHFVALCIVEFDGVYYVYCPQIENDTYIDNVCVKGVYKFLSLKNMCSYLRTIAYSVNASAMEFKLYHVQVSSAKRRPKKSPQMEISYGLYNKAIVSFKSAVCDGPTYICSSCSQTWFKEQVCKVYNLRDKYDMAARCLSGKVSNSCEWICFTCKKDIIKGKVPACSFYNGMEFPVKPQELELTTLEERLISPRIPFMQISEKPKGGQRSLRGNVVNVPTDVTTTVTCLPRCLTNSETIQVQLKRKLSYKHSYMHESVRPQKCLEALQWLLCNSELFQSEGICLNTSWHLDDEDEWLGNTLTGTNHEGDDDITDSATSDITTRHGVESETTEKHSKTGEDTDDFSEVDDFDLRFTGNTDTVMHPVNATLVEKIFSFAPGEGQTPLGLLQDEKSEYLSFPTIHCGKPRMATSDRYTQINSSMIYSWELRSCDRRAATCIPYIFYILRRLQIKQIQSQAQLVVRKCHRGSSAFTARDVLHCFDSLVRMNQGYRILRNIRGSPPYWESAKKDLFAMIRQLGIPTWFCSFSAAETKWTALLRILAKLNLGKSLTDEELNSMPWLDKCALIKKDPVTCARYFSHRFRVFFTSFLRGECEPLGKITDFFYRVEFQHRGSPHIHALFWVKDAPKYTEEESSGETVARFIDKHITCKKNAEISHLVNYQTHRHARTCRKKGKPICRFGFPIPPMPETKILVPFKDEEKESHATAKACYEKIMHLLKTMQSSDNVTYTEFLGQLDLSENEYILALRSSLASPKVFLKRECSESRVNSYSEMVLRAWEANIDVQFVLDSYACAAYIVSYISKGQRGMSELLSQATKEAKDGISSLKQQVRHIGNKFLTHVEVGAQEATFLILHMPLRMSSRSTVFINTLPESERGFLLKPVELLKKLDLESTDIEADNSLKRYLRRPKDLENMCLADFMSLFDICKIGHTDTEDDNCELIECSIETVTKNKCEKYILPGGFLLKRRKTAKIIRFANYSEKQDPENHFREQLMLFYPWRNEVHDLQGHFLTYRNSFESKSEVIITNKAKYCNNIELENILCEAALVSDDEPIASFSEAQHTDEIDRQSSSDICRSYGCFDPLPNQQCVQYDISMDIGITRKQVEVSDNIVHEMTNDNYLALARGLNCKQKQFFYHVLHWFKMNDQPLYCFLSGGAGVGKSVVVEAVYQALVRHWHRDITEHPDDAKIMLCAPTGKAAHNIHGHTIHSLFCIPANQSFAYKPLDSEQLDRMRVKFQTLKVIIIDEISMVGNKMFSYINLRLQEIFGNGKLFGGISLIVVGDLFQLKPVMDGWIFKDLTGDYGPLATNLWVELFQLYELTEIMRQKDDCAFAELLNRLREGKQTDQDIANLKSRVLSQGDEKLHSTKPHLYTTNKEVNKYNTETYHIIQTRKSVVEAIDVVSGDITQASKEKILNLISPDPCKTAGLLKTVMVAETLNADLCLNIDVSDGLTNGTSCKVERLDFRVHGSERCSIIWVSFHDKSIGKAMRTKFSHLYRKGIHDNWTPILEVTRKFTVGRHSSNVITRRQFPIRLAAAKTLHKSQGSTMKEAVLHFGNRMQDHMHYVGLSRIQCLSDVHILHFNEDKIAVCKEVQLEMERLRETCKLNLCYANLCEQSGVKILYHNTRSLHMHIGDIRCEANLLHCDIIAIAESRLIESDEDSVYQLPGFNMYRFDSVQSRQGYRPSKGFVIYSKLPFHNIASQTQFGVDTLTLQLTCFNEIIFIVFVYCSPHLASVGRMRQFFASVKSSLHPYPVLIMGDFNMEIHACLESFLRDNAYSIKLQEFTTDFRTKIDEICSINFKTLTVTGTVLESYYSDHKPILATILDYDMEEMSKNA